MPSKNNYRRIKAARLALTAFKKATGDAPHGRSVKRAVKLEVV